MARARTTWTRKNASPPPQIPSVGRTEDPDHPAYYPDPEMDEYESGDTSSWAEDPHPGPYPTPGSVPPAMPGNLVTEDVDHPAFVLKQAAFRREAQKRAHLCVRIASAMLPGATESVIERKAYSLMECDTPFLRKLLASLGKKAEEDEEEEVEVDEDESEEDESDEDESDEDEDEDEDMTASKKKASARKKATGSNASILKRLATLESLLKIAGDEDEVEAEDEEEETASKKASRRRLAKKAEEDEEVEVEEEETASKKAKRLASILLKLAEEDEDEEETASKKASARRQRIARLKAAKKAEEDEEVEVEEEETASKKASSRRRALKAAQAKKAAASKKAARAKKAADIKARKLGLMRLASAMKTRRGRKFATDFFGMDEDDLMACMKAEKSALMSDQMALYEDDFVDDVDMDFDDDGVFQNEPDYGYSDMYAGDEEEAQFDDLDMAGPEDMYIDDELTMDDEDLYAMGDESEDEGDLMAMLRSMAGEDEEVASKYATDAEDVVEPRSNVPSAGDGGNVNPPPAPETPQVFQSLKEANDPMGLLDFNASDESLDLIFGGRTAGEDEEAEDEEETASKKAAARKTAKLRPQPKSKTASGPKSLGTLSMSGGKQEDEIEKLSQIWGRAPDLSDL